MRPWPPRGVLVSGLLAALSACGDPPLVKLTLHYAGFEPACVQVQASDAAGTEQPQPQPVHVPPGTRSGDLTVMIWAKPGWSDQVRLSTEAHELSCLGPKVAGEDRTVDVARGQTTAVEMSLDATDADKDGFVAAPVGTDCDDAQASVHPGAPEICNHQNDNCAGGIDEGFGVDGPCGADGGCGRVQCEVDGGTFCANGSAFYPDGDGDGYGRTAEVVYQCSATPGFVRDPGDCQDDAGFVHPGAPEICDGLDDNCAGGADENLGVGAGCSTQFGCPGQNACAPDGGVVCQATGGGSGLHPDEDGDGHGAPVEVCNGDAGVPLVSSTDDCDDGDPFTAAGFPEICDRRDNDCDGQVDKYDAGTLACPVGAAWIAHQAGGTGHVWRSVWSWRDGGVWATGAGQKLRAHAPDDPYAAATQWPKNYDSDCANGTYTGVWADPGTGMAFTVGPAGLFCTHDLTSAAFQDQGGTVSATLPDPVALVGFRSGTQVEVYVAGGDGGTLRWFADAGSQALDALSGVQLRDVHGSSRDAMFAAGQAPGTPAADPRLYRFSPPSSWIQTPLPGPLRNSGASVEAVYVVGPRLAFAVTDGSSVLEWDGGTWAQHSAPPNAGPLRGVLAFGKNSLFVIDAKTAWEWNGGAWTRLLDAGTAGTLVDLHGTNPADIWVAQDPQMVYRWPQ